MKPRATSPSPTHAMHHHRLRMSAAITLGLLLSFAPACDEDNGDEQADETSGEGDGDGDGGDGDGDASDAGDGDGEGGDGDGDTGELMGCAALTTEADCLNELGCGPVRGYLLVEDGAGGFCTDAEEQFIGCASSGELCPMLGKTLCDGETMWRTTGCVPGNLTPCEAPGDITGACESGVGKL
jgi:hypothetical protein